MADEKSISSLEPGTTLDLTSLMALTVGSTGAGTGNTLKFTVAQLQAFLGAMETNPYILVVDAPGTYSNGETIWSMRPGVAVTLAAGQTGYYANCGTGLVAPVVGTIVANGASIGVFNFASAATVGTVTVNSTTTIAAGSFWDIVAPVSAVTSFGSLRLTMVGKR